MPPRTTRAIVQTAPRQLELRDLPVPDIDVDSALLRIEACGNCGSDVEQYTGGRGADVVIEVSSYATEPVAEALPYAASGARVVLAGEVPGEASIHSCPRPDLGR